MATTDPTTGTEISESTNYVLVVDDTADNRRLLAFYIKKAGGSPVLAENGQEGFDCAMSAWKSGHPFPLILLDMQMPVRDGYSTAGGLRQAGYSGKILAVTAQAMAEDRQRCLNAGCDDYMTKPVNGPELIEYVRRHLQPSSSSSAAA